MTEKPSASKKQPPAKFEEALKRLEEITDALDKRDVELDKALALFEEGAGLVRFCTSKLEETKKKIEILVKKNGAMKSVPFSPSDEEDEEKEENP